MKRTIFAIAVYLGFAVCGAVSIASAQLDKSNDWTAPASLKTVPIETILRLGLDNPSAGANVKKEPGDKPGTECKTASDCDALYPPLPGVTNICDAGNCLQAPRPPIDPNSIIACHALGERNFQDILRVYPGATQLAAYLSCLIERDCYQINGGNPNFELDQCVLSRNGGTWTIDDGNKFCESFEIMIRLVRLQLGNVDLEIMGVENSIRFVKNSIWALEEMISIIHNDEELARLRRELGEEQAKLAVYQKRLEALKKEKEKQELALNALLAVYANMCPNR